MPTQETAAPAGTATESSATPFEASVGELFGDYSSGGESPELTDEETGTTPETPAAGAENETGSATAETATPDGTTTTSDGATPDAATAADANWLTETTAAQYVVNGVSIPVEDIRVFKEGGAVIQPEALPNVLSKLAERDQLTERVRTREQEYQTLSKVSEWTGPDNQTVTGPQAAIERIVAHAAVLAENQLLVDEILSSPDLHAAGLLTTKVLPDGKGGTYEAVVFRPDAIKALQTRNELQQLKASSAIREHYGKILKDVKAQNAKVAVGGLGTLTILHAINKAIEAAGKHG